MLLVCRWCAVVGRLAAQLIDDKATLSDSMMELKNGCICCTIQDELADTARAILSRYVCS